VTQPVFRTKDFYIVTTLLDPILYTKEEIAAVYLKRWDVELFFRDIKTTMGFDILRSQSPKMIRKEIIMYFIAYNCIRRMMVQSAKEENIDVRAISFKGSLQTIRSWKPRIGFTKFKRSESHEMLLHLSLV
jgi:IS4 transposase